MYEYTQFILYKFIRSLSQLREEGEGKEEGEWTGGRKGRRELHLMPTPKPQT